MHRSTYENDMTLRLSNGCAIGLDVLGGLFRGLGSVCVNGTALRSGRRPMFVEIRNPDGVELSDYRLTGVQNSPSLVQLDFAMKQRRSGMMEWMLHSVKCRYAATDWSQSPVDAPDTHLRLEIHPVVRQLGSAEAVGFSYQYFYTSQSIRLYRLLDRSTWEVAGDAIRNEIWMRNGWTHPVVPITEAAQQYSTEWFQPNCKYPNIFQFVPLQTQLEGFTFTAHPLGVLVTWATKVSHIRTLLEKARGSSEIAHYHEHCQDLSGDLATSPMEVLFIPGGCDRVDRFNLYESVRELVADTLHRQVPMRRDRVCTYGVIEEWKKPDFSRYRELGLPKLLDAGVKCVYVANHFANNMNVHGVSNFCATLDLRVPRQISADQFRQFCRRVNDQGGMVEMWGNTALSTLALSYRPQGEESAELTREPTAMDTLSKAADPFVRNPSGAIEADHYTPSFAVLNLRDDTVREYWLGCWREAREQLGLGGIFLDSSFNLSSDKFHWVTNPSADLTGVTPDQSHLFGFGRPENEPPSEILSQYRAYLELMASMQQMGYRYCAEDLGVFGIHRHGPHVLWRVDSMPLWGESIANFDPTSLTKAGHDPDDVFFRGLAYRMMWTLFWHAESDQLSFSYLGTPADEDRPRQLHFDLLKAFNAVNVSMVHRQILPDETAVKYDDGHCQVFWCFKPVDVPLHREAVVLDVLAGTRTSARQLAAAPRHVYVVEPAPAVEPRAKQRQQETAGTLSTRR